MDELDTNVSALRPRAGDPTNALRQRRHRKRKARSTVTAPARRGKITNAEKLNDIKSNVTVSVDRWNAADVTAYAAAIALAGAAAWFSIRGMVVLFPGSPMSVVAMAVAMEGAKLVTAGWLARRWQATAWVWRAILVALVLGLAVINATGVYAQLVAAHVGDRVAATSAFETQDAALAARIEVVAHTVADLDRRLGQIDTAIEEAARRGRTNAAFSAMEGQRKTRAALAEHRQREGAALADLKTERAALSAKGRQIETEAAPIRYVADLMGADTDSERAIRWLIALMVLCCDPLAIALNGRGFGMEGNHDDSRSSGMSGNAAARRAQVFPLSDAERPSLAATREV